MNINESHWHYIQFRGRDKIEGCQRIDVIFHIFSNVRSDRNFDGTQFLSAIMEAANWRLRHERARIYLSRKEADKIRVFAVSILANSIPSGAASPGLTAIYKLRIFEYLW